jgi:glycerol-3-phosphate O-acyltransferase / dihydroxyacetone phosphate acyltransferase
VTEAAAGGYGFVRALSRLLLGVFYERVEIVGEENVPPRGPLVVAANHHNSIVDAMILMATFRRPLRVLANAPLFRHFLIGPFLRLVGALPVNRRQEAGDDPQKNADLFAATTAALRAGEAIALFPEGRTQPEPALQTVRTGAARMLLAAEAAGARGVTLLPVGLVFDEPGTFRDGRALVIVGSPVETSGLAGRDPETDPAAARALTDRLTEALRAQIVETDDRQTLRLLKLVEKLWRDRDGAPEPPEGLRVLWLQGAARAHRSLRRVAPDRVSAFRRKLEAYDARCETTGLAAEQLSRWYTPASVARYVMSEGLSLLFGLPLAILGLLVHGLPYRLTAFAVRRIPHTDEEEATDKIVGGLVFYPLCWIAEGWAVHALFGRTALIAFLIAIPVTAFPALAWSERLRRVKTETAAFGRFLWNRDVLRRLRKERRELSDELHALAALAESGGGGPA